MSNFNTICYKPESPIAIVEFNRPDVLNAMNSQFWEDMETCLNKIESDNTISAVIFTGSGRAFSTGADLKESKTRSEKEYRRYLERVQEISLKILQFPKPTIAAINGYALGSGFEFALACDLRLAATDAQMGCPEVKVEATVTGGALRLLPEIVGMGNAKELLFTAEYINGEKALAIGLVNTIYPKEQLLGEAKKLAGKIAKHSSRSIRLIKKGLEKASEPVDLNTILQFEVDCCMEAVSTDDRSEVLKKFEKKGEKTH